MGEGKEPDWNPGEHQDVEKRFAQMAEMRERCPVAFDDRNGGVWDILRYEDVVATAADPDRFRNGLAARFGKAIPPLEYDPPAHRDFRRALAVFFSPKRIARLEPIMRENARELLTPMLAAGEGDLARGFSYPLPVLALCALLDIPADNWQHIKELSEASLLHDSADEEERKRGVEAHYALVAYGHEMIADRRANPRDPEKDITAAYLDIEIEGERLDDDTVAGALRLLISAGHNSTTSGLGNAILRLALDRELQDRLRAEPELIAKAVEEFLRLEAPVEELPRWAACEARIAGREIAAGERLALFWASANRDPAAFPDADQCIIERRPNRHLAFGHGIHTCVGAPLARMELRVALEELLAATTGFCLNGEVERPRFHRIGVTHLPLALER